MWYNSLELQKIDPLIWSP